MWSFSQKYIIYGWHLVTWNEKNEKKPKNKKGGMVGNLKIAWDLSQGSQVNKPK